MDYNGPITPEENDLFTRALLWLFNRDAEINDCEMVNPRLSRITQENESESA